LCIYANGFVAGKSKETLDLPKNPEGLLTSFDGVINPDFSDGFKTVDGVFLTFHDGHCLCQYGDWKTFFDYVDQIRQANDVDKLPIMVFFTGEDYSENPNLELDLELDDITQKPKEGAIVYVGISIRRRLVKNVGRQVSVLFKSGKTVIGNLRDYQKDEEYGEINSNGDKIYFKASEIRHVDTIV
jgi:hypothetical protein